MSGATRTGRRAIPLADAPRLRALARRTRLVQAVIAVSTLGFAGGAIGALGGGELVPEFLPEERTGVIALDVSASISPDSYARIRGTLDELARTDGRFALVVFSDIAYQALPPGTPAAELEAFARLFEVRDDPAGPNELPANPWTNAFVGGTRLSSGLGLARTIFERSGAPGGAVILVSDLDNDPTDAGQLVAEMLAYGAAGISLRLVGLDPSPEDAAYFQDLLDRPVPVAPLPEDVEVAPDDPEREIPGEQFPILPVALVAALVTSLALLERYGARLTWGRRPPGEEAA